jgi:E3 ubiquitin-protein ligase BRE1
MRQKEASDNERKNLSRTVEKQTKVVERLTASEAKLQEQIVRLRRFVLSVRRSLYKQAALEKQEAVFQRSVRTFEARLAEQTRESHEWRTRAENERQRYQHASRTTCPMCEKLHGREAELQQLREEVLRAKADAERAAVKARPPPPPLAAASSRETHLQGEINKCMVRPLAMHRVSLRAHLLVRASSNVQRARCACAAL